MRIKLKSTFDSDIDMHCHVALTMSCVTPDMIHGIFFFFKKKNLKDFKENKKNHILTRSTPLTALMMFEGDLIEAFFQKLRYN